MGHGVRSFPAANDREQEALLPTICAREVVDHLYARSGSSLGICGKGRGREDGDESGAGVGVTPVAVHQAENVSLTKSSKSIDHEGHEGGDPDRVGVDGIADGGHCGVAWRSVGARLGCSETKTQTMKELQASQIDYNSLRATALTRRASKNSSTRERISAAALDS